MKLNCYITSIGIEPYNIRIRSIAAACQPEDLIYPIFSLLQGSSTPSDALTAQSAL
ncbi:hypothetical protein ACFLS1_03395 [Verrucomicrobiota bacterium]